MGELGQQFLMANAQNNYGTEGTEKEMDYTVYRCVAFHLKSILPSF